MDPYRVPFEFDRTRAPRYRLVNVGPERLRAVTVLVGGRGVMPAVAPALLEPQQSLDFLVLGDDLARESTIVVRWLRPDGSDYLWRASF